MTSTYEISISKSKIGHIDYLVNLKNLSISDRSDIDIFENSIFNQYDLDIDNITEPTRYENRCKIIALTL